MIGTVMKVVNLENGKSEFRGMALSAANTSPLHEKIQASVGKEVRIISEPVPRCYACRFVACDLEGDIVFYFTHNLSE